MPNPALDDQAINDTTTIAEVKQFITDARKKAEDFRTIADKSWNEIEKRGKDGRLYGGYDLYRARNRAKFPLWWSAWKIKQPIVFARLSVPVLKDTQGDDPYGRTACVVGERFTRGILKTFDAFGEFAASVDDFLVTDFGWGRWFYRMKERQEPEKIRLQIVEQPAPEPQMGPDGVPLESEPLPPLFIGPDGQPVESPIFDDLGPYVETGGTVAVEDEQVYFESGVYSGFLFDPDARRYPAGTRAALEYQYSYRQFVEKFGKEAFNKLAIGWQEKHRNGTPIVTFEFHDKLLRECRYLAENSEDFFQPLGMTPDVDVQALSEVEGEKPRATYDNSDLYGLEDVFPFVEPLVMNASTKEFWPVPTYFQVCDILDDIHQIVNRMVLLTKAIRVRFLFDSSIRELKSLIGEASEATALGVPNLQESLMAGRGTLANLVQYLPVAEMIEGLKNMYEAFNQRLDMFYQATGLSDLIRGQTNPDSDKTYGERQMEGKFALNRIEPYQRKVQEWLKKNYALGMEMGLKLFKPETIDEYVTPQTLDPEDQKRYRPALELLKNNRRGRFRIDFETDSTIAINEQWRRAQAIDTANTITKMMESIAKVAETQPELASTEIKIASHVIGELADGKLFIDELQDSLEAVIERVSAPQEPEFDKDRASHEFSMAKLSADDRFRMLELQAKNQLEAARLGQKAQQDQIANQLAEIKMQLEQGADTAALQLAFTKLDADIQKGWADIELQRASLMQVAKAEGGKSEMEAFRLIIDERLRNKEISLAEAAQQLEAARVQLEAGDHHASLEERIATEARLQDEHAMNKEAQAVDVIARLAEAVTPEPPKAAPVTIDKSTTIHLKQDGPKKKPKGKK